MTGVEGYVESAAIGLLAGRFASAERNGLAVTLPPPTTAFGALLGHITGGADAKTFQPMNVNFGLFPDLEQHGATKGKDRGRQKKQLQARRAIADCERWLGLSVAAE
jgi:methylenetetrahydrofolate--tRNA-(uracil-5-)-methyltransferase